MMKMMKKNVILMSVLLSMLIFIPGVFAASGSAAVSGNPAQTMTFAVSGSNAFGDMVTGNQNVNTSANTVKTLLTTNAPWAITVNDALDGLKPEGTEGKMVEALGTVYITETPKVLENALNVGNGATYFILSGSQSTALWSGDAVTSQENFPWFRQQVASTDTRAGFGRNYRIVVTFTATAL